MATLQCPYPELSAVPAQARPVSTGIPAPSAPPVFVSNAGSGGVTFPTAGGHVLGDTTFTDYSPAPPPPPPAPVENDGAESFDNGNLQAPAHPDMHIHPHGSVHSLGPFVIPLDDCEMKGDSMFCRKYAKNLTEAKRHAVVLPALWVDLIECIRRVTNSDETGQQVDRFDGILRRRDPELKELQDKAKAIVFHYKRILRSFSNFAIYFRLGRHLQRKRTVARWRLLFRQTMFQVMPVLQLLLLEEAIPHHQDESVGNFQVRKQFEKLYLHADPKAHGPPHLTNEQDAFQYIMAEFKLNPREAMKVVKKLTKKGLIQSSFGSMMHPTTGFEYTERHTNNMHSSSTTASATWVTASASTSATSSPESQRDWELLELEQQQLQDQPLLMEPVAMPAHNLASGYAPSRAFSNSFAASGSGLPATVSEEAARAMDLMATDIRLYTMRTGAIHVINSVSQFAALERRPHADPSDRLAIGLLCFAVIAMTLLVLI